MVLDRIRQGNNYPTYTVSRHPAVKTLLKTLATTVALLMVIGLIAAMAVAVRGDEE